jgi:hypothetical protein
MYEEEVDARYRRYPMFLCDKHAAEGVWGTSPWEKDIITHLPTMRKFYNRAFIGGEERRKRGLMFIKRCIDQYAKQETSG